MDDAPANKFRLLQLKDYVSLRPLRVAEGGQSDHIGRDGAQLWQRVRAVQERLDSTTFTRRSLRSENRIFLRFWRGLHRELKQLLFLSTV